MSNRSDKQGAFQSVRWSLLLAFVRTTAAALVVFVGLAWGGLVILYPFAGLQQLTTAQWTAVVSVLVLSGAVTVVVIGGRNGFAVSRGLKRRMSTLNEATMLWANGRLGHRIVVQGAEDEIAELAHSLNGMSERLEEQVLALHRLVEKNQHLAQQAAGLAALEERARLARDLHDSVSQQLFAIGMTAGAANKLMGIDSERARPFLSQLEEMAAKAQAEMRALLLHLRPVELEGRSLAEALERFLHDVCPRHGIRYDFEAPGDLRLPEGIEAHLFRIAQEAVSNVIRHASATKLQVRLVQEGKRFWMSIADDGQGFDPAHARDGSYGMHSIRERAEEIGGTLEVRSAKEAGTELRVALTMMKHGEEAASGEEHSNPVGR